MDFSVDKTKNGGSELHQYQAAAFKAFLLEDLSLTREWYLAADAAAHFLRRKKACELLGLVPSSFIHQVATLMLSARERHERLSNPSPQKKNKAIEACHYWMTCSQILTSSSIEQLLTHLEAIQKKCRETFPRAIPFLQEAENYFRVNQRTQEGRLSHEEDLLSYRWSSIIYDAFFLTTKINPLAEEILMAHRKAISAINAHHYERAEAWSLMVFIKANISDEKQKQLLSLFEEKLLTKKESATWQTGFYWLLSAVEAQRKTEEPPVSENQFLITAHHQAARKATLISQKWQRLSNVEIGKKSPLLFNCLSQYWRRLARQEERRHRSFIKIVIFPEVTFCIPSQCTPTKAQQQEMDRDVIYLQLQYDVFYNWIYQTWYFLTQAGIPCQLAHEPLSEGIVVTLGKSLSSSSQEKMLSKEVFLVDVVADNEPSPSGALHLIQNKSNAAQIAHSVFIPHWPQPHLISRDQRRKNRFENICFFGSSKNLAPEFQSSSWGERLQKELGLNFKIKNLQEWHDYSDVDCIMAIRDFSTSPHFEKPGTKLYNAWLAGVPFIGGSDTAYAADGHPGKNYLVATSLEETFQHLRRLKEDEGFRRSLVEEGKKSARDFTQQAILERWKNLVLETIPVLAIKRYEKAERLFKFAEADEIQGISQHRRCPKVNQF